MGRPASRHQIEHIAAGIRRAAAEAGVKLSVVYARRVAAEGLAQEADLGVTRIGAGVVIHTAPEAKDCLPAVVGYADARGQWHRDGSRHMEVSPVEGPAVGVGVGV